MKFSSQEEYGLRCLINLARKGGAEGARTIPEISRDEGLSIAYVAKLMRILRLAGFVDSARGVEGGYTLAGPPERIAIGSVMSALGGRFYEEDFCEKYPGTVEECAHTTSCTLKPLWFRLQSAIDDALQNVTLADLAANDPHARKPAIISPDALIAATK